MAKTEELLHSLERAYIKLEETERFPSDSEPHREATIQRFEYTFELCWKVMSSILADQNMPTVGVRNIIRNAAKLGLIDNPQLWLTFAEARNMTSHMYKEDVATKVFEVASTDFISSVVDLIAAVRKEIQQ